VLRAWWPLAVLPVLGVDFGGGIGVSIGVSTATLLLALTVSAAVDTRLSPPPPRHWLRGNTPVPAIAGFCLLVVSALDIAIWRVGDFRINPLAIPPALIFLAAIRWEKLACAIWPERSRRAMGLLAIALAAWVLSSWVLKGTLAIGPISLRFGSYSLATLVPLLCFGLVVLGDVRPVVVAGLLIAGLAGDRLLFMTVGDSIDLFALAEE